jgi:hypothetical protein
MADVGACMKAAAARWRPHRADQGEAAFINMGRRGDPAIHRPIARGQPRHRRCAEREDAMPARQAFQGAKFAKEGSRFDLARHKVPPHPVKRRPEAPRHHKINVAVFTFRTTIHAPAAALNQVQRRSRTRRASGSRVLKHRCAESESVTTIAPSMITSNGGGRWSLRQAAF